jgi:2-polyprenyl-6-methoxyphenol hydroxylase-like FAD-dependent oxidoreductase
MAFGRVCILGDAAFVARPHTAASTSKAATNAMALANSITSSSNVNVVEALKRWEPSQLELKLS